MAWGIHHRGTEGREGTEIVPEFTVAVAVAVAVRPPYTVGASDPERYSRAIWAMSSMAVSSPAMVMPVRPQSAQAL